MADRFGKYLTNVISGARDKLAPGSRFNARLQSQTEVVPIDDGGANAIATTIGCAKLRAGDVPKRFIMTPTVTMTGLTLAIGTKAAPTKYSAAVAVAVANTPVIVEVVDAAEIGTAGEEIYATTGGAIIPVTGGGKLQIETVFTG
jgi:hypothetical protein